MRGLESLIPNYKKESSHPPTRDSVFLIETKLIKPNTLQPRREFAKAELQELATSIKKYGILQPLIVSKVEEEVSSGRKVHYELIAGERRLRAAKLARVPQVPVVVRDSVPGERLEISLIENIQREDLNPVEEARAYKHLIEDFGLSQQEVATRVGKSRPVIANAVRMLRLPQDMIEAVSAGVISDGHTRPILSLRAEKDQRALFDEIKTKKFSVRDAEDRARAMDGKDAPRVSKRTSPDPELALLASKFKAHPHITRAHIRSREKNIKLALEFPTKNEFLKWVDSWLS